MLQHEDEKPSADATSVQDNGDGSHTVTYTVTKVGPFTLELAVDGQAQEHVRRLSGQCVAARAVGRSCTVQAPPQALVAGERGCVRVTRNDRCVEGSGVFCWWGGILLFRTARCEVMQ